MEDHRDSSCSKEGHAQGCCEREGQGWGEMKADDPLWQTLKGVERRRKQTNEMHKVQITSG